MQQDNNMAVWNLTAELWEVCLDRVFEYKPRTGDNGWSVGPDPTLQYLNGEMAICFLNCREVCRDFDYHMLQYLTRFTMTPTKYVRDPIELDIEFEHRAFSVAAEKPNSSIRDILYHEYRRYTVPMLAAHRELIRRKQVHDDVPCLPVGHPNIQYWLSLGNDQIQGVVLQRNNQPWYLSEKQVHLFQARCRNLTRTTSDIEEEAQYYAEMAAEQAAEAAAAEEEAWEEV